MPSSSSAASASSADPSTEDTLSDLAAMELQPGHTVEFGTSRISSVHVQEMQQVAKMSIEVCLGSDFVRRSAVHRSLRQELLSALAKKENWK
jgi:hypothetical protein